jgi:hypothetical protein
MTKIGPEGRQRRPRGDFGVRYDKTRDRYIATATVGYDGRGKRVYKKASGKSETAALKALKQRIKEYEDGLVVGADRYTVKKAVEDWLELGHGRVVDRTTEKDEYLSRHVVEYLGARKLKDLTAGEVEKWLLTLAPTMTTRTLADVRSVLNRSVARAMARGLVTRNVVELVQTPRGKGGRGTRSLTLDQAIDVLNLTKGHWMYASTWRVTRGRAGRRRWRSGGRCARAATPRPRSLVGPSACPTLPSRRCGGSATGRTRSAARRGRTGRTPGSCSRRRSAAAGMRRTCGGPSGALWRWSQASTRRSGRPATCGTRSFR